MSAASMAGNAGGGVGDAGDDGGERLVAGVMVSCRQPLAPLMEAPAADARQASQVLFGEHALLLEETNGWLRVRLEHDGYEGFVPRAACVPLRRAERATHVISVPQALRFPRADIKAAPALPLFMGTRLRVVEENEGFLRLDDGGWVRVEHARALDELPCADAATIAGMLLHAPYLWGGRTWAGIDCSGLVQLALRMAGHARVPRDSGDQAREVGRPLPLDWLCRPERLKRGDLVFWAGHVAMLVDGERIIHANAHHMRVVIEPLEQALTRITARGGAPVALRRP